MGIPPGFKRNLVPEMSLADETQAQEPFSGKGAINEGQSEYGEGGHQYHGRPEHEPRFADRAGVCRAIIEGEPVEGEGHHEEDGGAEKVGNRTLLKHRMEFFYVPHVYISGISCQGEFDWSSP